MRKFYVRFLLSFFLFLTTQSKAQTIASDNAADAAYAGGWKTGTNGGTGFNPWEINAGGNTGAFIGNPIFDEIGNEGIGTPAFGIYATGVPYLDAIRTFKKPLVVGDELSFYWAMNWDANTGTKGFDFLSGATTVFNIINATSKAIKTNFGDTALREYGTKPMFVKLKRTGNISYSFSMTGRVDGENYNTTFDSDLPVDGISFSIGFQQEGNGRRNIYFNNFKITSVSSSVNDLKNVKGISVYPNPLVNGTALQLEFINRAPGKYTVSLFNLSGLRVQQTIVSHAGGTATQAVQLSSSLAPGMYVAEITGNGKRENLKLMVK